MEAREAPIWAVAVLAATCSQMNLNHFPEHSIPTTAVEKLNRKGPRAKARGPFNVLATHAPR